MTVLGKAGSAPSTSESGCVSFARRSWPGPGPVTTWTACCMKLGFVLTVLVSTVKVSPVRLFHKVDNQSIFRSSLPVGASSSGEF